MIEAVITVKNLSKRYRLGLKEKKAKTFTGQVADAIKSPLTNFKRLAQLSKFHDADESVFWALQDVNFDVKEGEVLGIIGYNGAGKSTLLKILARITEPSKGEVRIRGRIAALLEVGTGFHAELTGRENVFMNGTILGMTKSEVMARFDEIVEFSGVDKFLDTPVKFYSSGMKVRLGFAVAAHLEPEILIVDEVLAVGDVEFQKKCLGKMNQIASSHGRTVLFVSHNMSAVRSLCSRAILLKNGQIEIDGNTEEVVTGYLKGSNQSDGFFEFGTSRESVGITKVILKNSSGQVTQDFRLGEDIVVEMHYEARQREPRPYFFVGIKSKFGPVTGANALIDGHTPDFVEGKGVVTCVFKGLPLLPQQYTLTAGVRGSDGKAVLGATRDVAFFDVVTKLRDIGLNGLLADSLASKSVSLMLPYSWQFNGDKLINVDLIESAKKSTL